MTLQRILSGISEVLGEYIEAEDREQLTAEAFDVLLKKTQTTSNHSLRNVIITNMLPLASTKAQTSQLKKFLKDKAIPLAKKGASHPLIKSQRYGILRSIFKDADIPQSEKDSLLAKEMKMDSSDVDELQKIRCQACLPTDENKAELWEAYIKKEKFSNQQFQYSSASFRNRSNKAQFMKYADLFFEKIDFVKTTYHRDYAEVFFQNLSPAAEGEPAHLAKFVALHKAIAKKRPDDSHFLKLLGNEIQRMEETVKIKNQWKKKWKVKECDLYNI